VFKGWLQVLAASLVGSRGLVSSSSEALEVETVSLGSPVSQISSFGRVGRSFERSTVDGSHRSLVLGKGVIAHVNEAMKYVSLDKIVYPLPMLLSLAELLFWFHFIPSDGWMDAERIHFGCLESFHDAVQHPLSFHRTGGPDGDGCRTLYLH
jgi:hypothetical protein